MNVKSLSIWKSVALVGTVLSIAATVTAAPSTPPAVAVIASDGRALEGVSSGSFTVLRFGSASGPLQVNLTVSGTASNGVDYTTIPTSVTIPDGLLAVDVPVLPIIDTVTRGNKTVVLSVNTNSSYRIARSTAKVEIVDDVYTVPPPTVDLVTPADGTVYSNLQPVVITADISDPAVPISNVSFYVDDDFVGSTTNMPYSFTWSNVHNGKHAIFVRAVDTVGQSTLSSVSHITVSAHTPVVSITSPANHASLAGGNITIRATASESGGSVATVDFYFNNLYIGTAASKPYTVIWPGVNKGTYQLTAVATDPYGSTATSSVVNVTVTSNAVGLPGN